MCLEEEISNRFDSIISFVDLRGQIGSGSDGNTALQGPQDSEGNRGGAKQWRFIKADTAILMF